MSKEDSVRTINTGSPRKTKNTHPAIGEAGIVPRTELPSVTVYLTQRGYAIKQLSALDRYEIEADVSDLNRQGVVSADEDLVDSFTRRIYESFDIAIKQTQHYGADAAALYTSLDPSNPNDRSLLLAEGLARHQILYTCYLLRYLADRRSHRLVAISGVEEEEAQVRIRASAWAWYFADRVIADAHMLREASASPPLSD